MAKIVAPTPEEIREKRLALGLSQTEAAEIVRSGLRAWQEWEAGNRGMHPAFWELFCMKTARRKPKARHWASK